MLTRLRIRNLKRFDDIDVELGPVTVLIGPNNSGKTTALQALALWEIGIRRWNEKRKGKTSPEKRPGVTINRRDLLAIPVPEANLLWRDRHVRNVDQVEVGGQRKPKTENIRIDVIVDGVGCDKTWSCGLEFDYANEESIYCRPLRESARTRMSVPQEAGDVRVALLPPMSGLAAVEPKWEPGRVSVLIGEGQTAQVLRNLCYQLVSGASDELWNRLCRDVDRYFGVELMRPRFVAERGEITMEYRERGVRLDLASAGRGLQQTLLLLAHLYANPRTVLLLDEPDAHLEILRQRQIYGLLTEAAKDQGSQIIAASHSEVVLNEAARQHTVVAFVGRPHRIDDRGAQVLKSLRDIGFHDYLQAEQTGWVLYLEGSTDLAILQAFAKQLGHAAASVLERPFAVYVGNQPGRVREHFYGLREAKPDLVAVALFDHVDSGLPGDLGATGLMWKRREIENYLPIPGVLTAYALHDLDPGGLFDRREAEKRKGIIESFLKEEVPPVALDEPGHRYWMTTKISDDLLAPLFERYFEALKLPNLLRKTNYHVLAALAPPALIPPEVTEKLDQVLEVSKLARPRGS